MRNVVILGMHRSGTSMVAEALAAGGIFVGEPQDLLQGREDNPHGFWERQDVVALNDAILLENNASWYCPPQLAPTASPAQLEALVSIVNAMPQDCSWLIKDPRQLITWPLWQQSLGDAVLVFVYRDPLAVAVSLQRRNGFPLAMGLLLWEHYNRLAIAALQGRDYVCVSYEDVAADPQGCLSALLDQLADFGVACKTALKDGVFDSSLGHSRAADDALVRSLMSESQTGLATYCEALVKGGELPALPAADVSARARLVDMGTALAPLATVLEARIELEEMTALCNERTRERDTTLSELRQLDADHKSLARAHEQESTLHHSLAIQHESLEVEHQELAEAHHAQVAQHEELLGVLTNTYRSLLEFELSSLAGIWRNTARLYKLFTLRRGTRSRYDDVLSQAREHFKGHAIELPAKPPGKAALLGDVVQYVFENPAGSARSFSFARLQRALSIFFRSNPDDLEVWVNSRFPERERASTQFDTASLDAGLDRLEISFPAVAEPQVSIIIPVYNDYRLTKNCLHSLLEHTSDIAYEVIIADDCSMDLTASIEERVANITVVRGEENLRFLGNCNRAAAQARGKYLLFLNNDTAVCDNWLQPMLDVAESDSSVGIVGPKLLFANGKLQEAGAIMWRDGSAWNFGRMDDAERPEYNYLKQTDYISGACLMIRHDLWRQLGGFDTRYAPAYYEDADIAFAARDAGYKVVYQPLSRVFHFEGVSNGTDLNSGVKQYQVQNQEKFREKWARELDAFHFNNAQHVCLARDRSRERRSILFIDHYVPHYDKDAGSRSTFMYVRQMLEMGYRVMFLGANYFPHKPYTQTLQQLGVEVLVGEYMARNQDRWLQENAPYIDRIYLHRPHVAEQFLGSLEKMSPRPPVIFFGHDLHYLRINREFALSGEESLVNDAQKWRKREYAVFDRVDQVYYPSQIEVEEVSREAPHLKVRSIPLYILPDSEPASYDMRERQDILFVGGFNHPPNVDGIVWFVEEVLPLVSAKCPEIKLHVVGSNPTDAVDALQNEQVVVYGYLSDEELDTLYGRVRQAIVPLRFGAGVKGKVLEAIQKNLPLVTTSVGAEGIPQAESVMHIADTAEDFAAKVLEVDAGAPEVADMMSGYHDWLQENFSKENAAHIILEDFGPPLRESPEPSGQLSAPEEVVAG